MRKKIKPKECNQNRIDMLFDCAIIGGGPAGLNAALILGRAIRNVILFDNNNPRNAVTLESHGFITRDGIKPQEFREISKRIFRLRLQYRSNYCKGRT